MVERKGSVRDQQGKQIAGTIVDVAESNERFSHVTLEDGSILKVKVSVLEALRVDDQWDPDGNPTYIVKSHNVVAVSESPEQLRRKVQ